MKVPLAAATLERVRRGDLDGATQLEVAPGGNTGVAQSLPKLASAWPPASTIWARRRGVVTP